MTEDIPFGSPPKITNVVASGRFSKTINLAKLCQEGGFIEVAYEPECHPALNVKIMVNGEKRHVSIYRNGKFIILGAKSEKEVMDIYNEILRILTSYNYL